MQHIGVYGAARGLGSALLARIAEAWVDATSTDGEPSTSRSSAQTRRLKNSADCGNASATVRSTWERAWLAVRDANRTAGKD
jgi:hypothetical protein